MPSPTSSPPDRRSVDRFGRPIPRRTFLAAAGVTVGAFVVGCGSDNTSTATQTTPATGTKDQGEVLDFSSVIGVLNYAYALEQLEAAFYTKVNGNLYSGGASSDSPVLQDIMAHEIVHAAFLKAVLADKAIGPLEFDFSKVDFTSRDSVLSTALTFENLGVAAYNGAGALIKPDNPLKLVPIMAAGEIVSVEARHAANIAAIQKRGQSGAFAPSAFDKALKPSEVLPKVLPFIKTKVQAKNLPAGA